MKATDLVLLFERELREISEQKLEEIGIVLQVGDTICSVYGLQQAILGETIEFEGGNRGIAFQLDADFVSVFLFDTHIPVTELEVAKRTGEVFKIGVGPSYLGRVVSPVGAPLDGMGDIVFAEMRPIESIIPSIMDRSPVNEPLETGIIAIDALVPIGKGQRELLIGNRGTGKTSIALDIILNQKDKDVICILVVIGGRLAHLARTIRTLEENGALAYTVIVLAEAGEPVLNQYIAPYVGCTMGEYFRDQGKDVLIVYDDLSNHAIAFREMSLLLRRAPGREAYPGDVFYLHSRLLERAGKLASGGSLTAIPIAQIQSDDITAYIPTNLISITDGQIFLDTKLFKQGIRPAVNTELSVSRVGGAAQTPAMRRMTKALRLDLAQYHELLNFAQFDTELDPTSKRQLMRGALAVELLKQGQHVRYSLVDQVLILFLFKDGLLDSFEKNTAAAFVAGFVSYVRSVYKDLYIQIEQTKDLSDAVRAQLVDVAIEFKKISQTR